MIKEKTEYNPNYLELSIKKFRTLNETPKIRYAVSLYYPIDGKRRCITKKIFEEDTLKLQHINWMKETGEYYLQDCLTWSTRHFLQKITVV